MNVELAQIRRLVAYDPHIKGNLRRLISRGNSKAGTSAGRKDSKGYWRSHIDGKDYKNHHLVWFLCTGVWPAKQLDHINRNKEDNRIENLREVDGATNCLNQTVRKTNVIGLQGVHLHKQSGKFRAALTVNGCRIELGLHASPELAHAAYVTAKAEYQ